MEITWKQGKVSESSHFMRWQTENVGTVLIRGLATNTKRLDGFSVPPCVVLALACKMFRLEPGVLSQGGSG